MSAPGLAERLRGAVAERRQELIELTCALVREPSLTGQEEGAQALIERELVALGFEVERVAVEPPREGQDSTWGYPPASYDGRTCVAARLGPADGGPSLHLSGHIDVVPVEAPGEWRHDPWGGEVADGRIWGRGAGDMKAGLAAYLIGAGAFLQICGAPAGELLFSSVIEEECTGNGMKAVLAAGYDAQATLIGEPSALQLMHAGVGVIWARLQARSAGAHVAFSSGEASSVRLLDALAVLRELELRLNGRAVSADRRDDVFLSAHERPFRVNFGTLGGGVWPSSEPAEAHARVRVGFGLSHSPAQVQELVREALAAIPGVEVSFEGFRAPAYCDGLEHDLARALTAVHEQLHGAPPQRQALPGTTDARSVGGPCVCYGPVTGAIHATDEWVEIDSVEAVAAAIALTIARFQGVAA